MYRNLFVAMALIVALLMTACYSNDDLEYQFYPKSPAKITLHGYAQNDTLIIVGRESDTIKNGESKKFTQNVMANYEFSFESEQSETVKLISLGTGETVGTIEVSPQAQNLGMQLDTLTFFYKPTIWIEDVFRFEPGELSQENYTGFKFIFPNINSYSNSGYEGKVDAVLKRFPTGQSIGTVENIGSEDFSTFIEFPFTDPNAPAIPIITVEIVKHATNESYLANGEELSFQLSIEEGTSKLLIMEETFNNEEENFGGINASIDLRDYFDYE